MNPASLVYKTVSDLSCKFLANHWTATKSSLVISHCCQSSSSLDFGRSDQVPLKYLLLFFLFFSFASSWSPGSSALLSRRNQPRYSLSLDSSQDFLRARGPREKESWGRTELRRDFLPRGSHCNSGAWNIHDCWGRNENTIEYSADPCSRAARSPNMQRAALFSTWRANQPTKTSIPKKPPARETVLVIVFTMRGCHECWSPSPVCKIRRWT